MAGFRIEGDTSGNVVEVDSNKNLYVKFPQVTPVSGSGQPTNVGAVRSFSENDAGTATGTPYLLSSETTDDAKLRTTLEIVHDQECFNYTAQNTGKHTYLNTTMTIAWTTGGMQTNSGSATAAANAVTMGTYAEFPVSLGAHNLYHEIEAQISLAMPSNTTIDFGLFRRGAAQPYAPTDGVYFRLNASGLFGIVNYGGAETPSTVFTFVPTPGSKAQYLITANEREVQFWVNGILQGAIDVPAGQGQPWMSSTLPFSLRHAIVGGAAGTVVQMLVTNYTVSQDNPSTFFSPSQSGNLLYGSYQGLSGGTMGSLANYANSANPTAAVPTNTTAALGSGLGGQFWETDTLAVTTDGIIQSYQAPAGTTAIQGRRLLVYGIRIDTYVQTALTGGGYNEQWSLAYGGTAVSLATAEAAAAKAPRRVALGSRTVAAALTALTQLPTIQLAWTQPLVINPGEFIQAVKKKVGTAPSAGVMAHTIFFDYGWI